MNTASIGKQIRKFREHKGWRQEDFAEKIGLSVTYTGMIERGLNSVGIQECRKFLGPGTAAHIDYSSPGNTAADVEQLSELVLAPAYYI